MFEGKSALLMKMNWDDRRAHGPGRTDDELGRTDDEPGRTDDLDPATDQEQPGGEPPLRRVRLGAAWRLPVILAAAAEMDGEEPDAP